MGVVVQLPISRPRKDLVAELEALLAEARTGELISLVFLVEDKDLGYKFGMVGDYTEAPERAFGPATKCMYEMSIYINQHGRQLCV